MDEWRKKRPSTTGSITNARKENLATSIGKQTVPMRNTVRRGGKNTPSTTPQIKSSPSVSGKKKKSTSSPDQMGRSLSSSSSGPSLLGRYLRSQSAHETEGGFAEVCTEEKTMTTTDRL